MKRWPRTAVHRIIHLGWDGTAWKHLMLNGSILNQWSNCENEDYTGGNGVFVEAFGAPADLSLSATEVTVEVGQTLDLQLFSRTGEVYEPLVVWESEDASIATATGGKVNGIAVGKTTVTASYPGSNEKASCTVTVVPSTVPEIPVISISQTTLNVEVKQKAALQILANGKPVPYQLVTWSSSAWFVQIDKYGIITPNSKGTVTITGVYDGQSYTCTVNVYPVGELPEEETTTEPTTNPPTEPEDLLFESLTGNFQGVQAAGTKLQFQSNVSGGSGSYRYIYYISKNGHLNYVTQTPVKESSFSYTPQEQATYTVLAYCYDGYGGCVSKTLSVVIGGNQ